ncbi:hypothetical protein ACQGSX_25290, partial [Bacillus sp. GMs2/1]|uniref:hypothetical protein n=1 Tax=Bacillus sp. GMs2/1 TaxID=3418493 RepID=UPI003CF7C6CA
MVENFNRGFFHVFVYEFLYGGMNVSNVKKKTSLNHLSGVKETIKLTESSLPASFQMDSLNKNQKSLSGVKGTIKLTESSLPANFQ